MSQLQTKNQERLIKLFNSAWEYSCYDISDNDVELILANGGYFMTSLCEFEIPLNLTHLETFKSFMSEKEVKWHEDYIAKNGENKGIFDCSCIFNSIEDARRINTVLSVFGEESLFALVIKGVDENGKEHFASITEWMFD